MQCFLYRPSSRVSCFKRVVETAPIMRRFAASALNTHMLEASLPLHRQQVEAQKLDTTNALVNHEVNQMPTC